MNYFSISNKRFQWSKISVVSVKPCSSSSVFLHARATTFPSFKFRECIPSYLLTPVLIMILVIIGLRLCSANLIITNPFRLIRLYQGHSQICAWCLLMLKMLHEKCNSVQGLLKKFVEIGKTIALYPSDNDGVPLGWKKAQWQWF